MKATVTGLGALLLFAVSASLSQAANPYYPCRPYGTPAPDACGPGSYCQGPCGMTYGPNYNLRPPFPPFNGMLPAPKMPQQPPQISFPTHPFARGPRDFFMLD
jgi:hypothetical protein